MELYAPTNLDLPPLYINLRNERQAIEESPDVEALIATNLLLDAAFHSLFIALVEKSKKLVELIELQSKAKYAPFPQWSMPSPGPALSDLVKPKTNTFVNFVVEKSSTFTGRSADLFKEEP